MVNLKKIVVVFLPLDERNNLDTGLTKLEQVAYQYYIIVFSSEMRDLLAELANSCPEESFILQIVSHGNCDYFGSTYEDRIEYSEITETLRNINQRAKNGLILNLMTVCCSVHQLNFFNESERKIFHKLIGSMKGSAVHGSIIHSIKINNTPYQLLETEISYLNDDLNDYYSKQIPETHTYRVI